MLRQISPPRLLFAALVGLLLTQIGLWLGQATGLSAPHKPIVLTKDQLRLQQGQGEGGPNGIIIHQAGPRRTTILVSRLRGVSTEIYTCITWQLEGLSQEQELSLVWISDVDPRRVSSILLNSEQIEAGELDLTGNPAWTGQLQSVGLMIRGEIDDPLTIRQLTLTQPPGAFTQVLWDLTKSWSYRESWQMSSINFRERANQDWLWNPLGQTIIWLVISSGVFLALSSGATPQRLMTGVAVLALVGWLALDLQWQWQLLGRLSETYERYATLPPSQSSRIEKLDGSLAELAEQVRTLLPTQSTRVILVTADPGSYVPIRMRYHLLPLNVHPGLTSLPAPKRLRPGDHLLLIMPPEGIRYSDSDQRLLLGRVSLPVDLLLDLPGVAGLYKIRVE